MKYLITFSYDGSGFNGFQRQSNKKTIQGEIEKILTKVNQDKQINIHASGRTDAGVHALNQKAHFDLETKIKPTNLLRILNSNLNGEIYVKDIKIVEESFHSRYNILKKEYHYFININEYNPLQKNYIYQYNKKLNIQEMRKAIKKLKGTHDFRSFCTDEKDKENCVRTLKKLKIKKRQGIIEITFVGDGFLKYMVRNIVGLLIEVGNNKRNPEEVKYILENVNRKHNTKTAPACGLYLWDVVYKK